MRLSSEFCIHVYLRVYIQVYYHTRLYIQVYFDTDEYIYRCIITQIVEYIRVYMQACYDTEVIQMYYAQYTSVYDRTHIHTCKCVTTQHTNGCIITQHTYRPIITQYTYRCITTQYTNKYIITQYRYRCIITHILERSTERKEDRGRVYCPSRFPHSAFSCIEYMCVCVTE